MTDLIGLRSRELSRHRNPVTAGRKARRLQDALDSMARLGIGVQCQGVGGDLYFTLPQVGAPRDRLPQWTRSFRVQRTGRLQWAVVAAERRS